MTCFYTANDFLIRSRIVLLGQGMEGKPNGRGDGFDSNINSLDIKSLVMVEAYGNDTIGVDKGVSRGFGFTQHIIIIIDMFLVAFFV